MTSSVAGAESAAKRPSAATDDSGNEPRRKSLSRPDTGPPPPRRRGASASPTPSKENGALKTAAVRQKTVKDDAEATESMNESEAETERQFDQGGTDGSPAKGSSNTVPKVENTGHRRLSDISSHKDSVLSRASPDGVKPGGEAEGKETRRARRKAGVVKAENGVPQENGRAASSPPHKRDEQSPSDKEQSSSRHETPLSPRSKESQRERSTSLVPSRKRKNREEITNERHEPPRQRQKSVASARDSARDQTRPGKEPVSPTATSSRQQHKRSASSQIGVQSAPPRKRRDQTIPAPLTMDVDDGESDAPSDSSSSPLPPHFPRQPSRGKRSSHRSLISPVRNMARKNTDKFGATRLARESEKGEIDLVKEAYEAAPEELDQDDYAGITPLQKAALQGHTDIVEYLLRKGCRTDVESKNGDTPLIDSVENGHLATVRLLLNVGHVNPHHQNRKGQRALDVVNSKDENSERINKELRKAMRRESKDEDAARSARQEAKTSTLLYNEYNTETLRDKAAEGDMAAVAELLNSNIKPNNACGVAAARGGHDEILSVFLGVGLKSDPDPGKHSETPMTVAIGRGHLKVIEMLLDQDGFDPTRRDRRGRTYWETASERRGPKWQQEHDMLKSRYDAYRRSQQAASGDGSQRTPEGAKKRHGTSSPSTARSKMSKASSPASYRQLKREHSPPSPGTKKARRRVSSPDRQSASSPTTSAKKAPTLHESKVNSSLSREKSDKPDKSKSNSSAKENTSHPRELIRRRRVVDEDSSSGEEDSKKSLVARKSKASSKSREPEDRKREGRRVISKGSQVKEEASSPAMKDIPSKTDAELDRKAARQAEAQAKKAAEDKRQRKLEEEHKKKADAEKRAAEEKKLAEEQKLAEEKKAAEEKRLAEEKRVAEEKKAMEEKRLAEERKKREEEAERQRVKAEEERKRIEAEEAEKRRVAAEEERKRKEAEQAAAAQRKREEEEAARLASEQLARERRQAMLSSLPLQLRLAVEKGANRPIDIQVIDHRNRKAGIDTVFLPIHTVAFCEIDPSGPASWSAHDPPINDLDAATAAVAHAALPRDQQLWMISYQAVGVLGLPEPDATSDAWPFPSWERLPVTAQQFRSWMEPVDTDLLAHEFLVSYQVSHTMKKPDGTTISGTDMMKIHQDAARTARKQLWGMRPMLQWVRYADFLQAVAARPDLKGLKVFRTSCSHAVDRPRKA